MAQCLEMEHGLAQRICYSPGKLGADFVEVRNDGASVSLSGLLYPRLFLLSPVISILLFAPSRIWMPEAAQQRPPISKPTRA